MSSDNPLVVVADGPNDAYLGMVRGIVENGEKVVSRNLETKEIRPVMLILKDPRQRFLTCPGRNINPIFQIMESIWIMSGRGDVKWISYFLKNMETFSDNKPYFNAPYGTRMRRYGVFRNLKYLEDGDGVDQFRHCYLYLREAPDTRHAAMVFWSPFSDHFSVKTIDRPCNIAFHFLVRDGRLDLTIFNRSNDIHWGLFNTNVVQFSVILEFMSLVLGIPVGRQIHMINSLHFYTNSPITKSVLDENPKDRQEFNVYNHANSSAFSFQKDRVFDKYDELSFQLAQFMRASEKIIFEEILYDPFDGLTVNYLVDAMHICIAFHMLKTRASCIGAVEEIFKISADDIYITCAEWFARRYPEAISAIRAQIRTRFGNRFHSSSFAEIDNYVCVHNFEE